MVKLHTRSLFSAATLFAALFAASPVFAANDQQNEAIPGEYLVKLKPQISVARQSAEQLSFILRGQIKSTIPNYNIVVVKRPYFELDSTSQEMLSGLDGVERVTPNYIYHIVKTPNDKMYGQLWGMNNTGQTDSKQTGVAGVDIGAEKAWDLTTGSKDVVVAVIDTGVNYNHPDLKENMWVNEKERDGKPGVDDDGNGFVDDIYGYNFSENNGDPMDDHGHGSHCSGTIGAKGNNNDGVVGVNWDVRIMAVKFLSKDGSGSLEGAIKAIDYATKNGAKILSNSWGGGGFNQDLMDVIADSNKAGAVFVAAAGNSSANNDTNPGYPASYAVPNIISVAAVDNKGALAYFSSYGKKSVHVGAPGVNVLSITLNGLEYYSGTSMATPHVSGIAALLASYEPNLNNLEIKKRILSTAVPLASLKNKTTTRGIANAWTALKNITPAPDMNDPAMWSTMDSAISTKHPYEGNASQSWEVSVPNAKQIALYFSKFSLEDKYDFLELYDANGKLITKYSGNMDESFSDIIEGNYVKIVFKSDEVVNMYGFDLSKIAYR